MSLRSRRAAQVGRGFDLRRALVAGDADATPLTCGGIKAGDIIVSATVFQDVAALPTDVTAEVSIPSAGHIQLATTDTTGHVIDLLYWSA